MKETIKINGMTCRNCERTIKEGLSKIEGIKTVSVSFKTGNLDINYDPKIISKSDIEKAVNNLGYSFAKEKSNEVYIVIFVILLALFFQSLNLFNSVPEIDESISYGMLLVIGFLTSFHCIFMCGGINLAATANTGYRGGIKYNAGRIVSYTLIGGVIGALGSVIAFNQVTKDLINIFVGSLMFIMGLQMLRIITLPKLKMFNKPKVKTTSPFIIGLLNGFMPCGPLQAMQLYALSTGSFMAGALSMFLFSIGTVPLMLAFSFMAAFTTRKRSMFLKKMSAVFILLFGLMIVLRSVELPTIKQDFIPSNAVYATDMGDYQEVKVRFERGRYMPIVVEKDKKVIWTIIMEPGDLNGCNDQIYIPEFDLSKDLEYGSNTVEFTPTEIGTYKYTCWMNMLKSNIYVIDDL